MPEFIEMPATKRSISMRKPVHGVGINDANYVVQPLVDGKQVMCPYYQAWNHMLTRCYSQKYQAKHPTYIGCEVVKEWLTFSNFRAWMETQDWEGKQLDKDILVIGNKTYSPDACLLVSSQINTLLNDCAASRGDLPKGVSFHKGVGKYVAKCRVIGKLKHLGYFTLIPKAEYEYLTFKSDLIKKIANEDEALGNPRLQEALLAHSDMFKQKANSIITLL